MKKAMTAIHAYELELSRALISTLQTIPGIRLYGLTDSNRLEQRVATFSFRIRDIPPRKVAEQLAKENIYVWDGNYYALNVTEQLDVERTGQLTLDREIADIEERHDARHRELSRGDIEIDLADEQTVVPARVEQARCPVGPHPVEVEVERVLRESGGERPHARRSRPDVFHR